ncbi:AMP-binding protein [Azohydromonas aeria]|uniref:AMP-binding protein n=1 Tax=Azohydromonas aeria TaxID=2590212 RepID=UPI001E5CF152|nr:AMP-binding protein [Azohydromonas aeria]
MLPLLSARDLDTPLAWRGGVPVSARQFLRDVAQQAERLPAQGAALNLCVDRYHFSVAFGATLLRGHVSLFPPNAMAQTIDQLRPQHPLLWALADEPSVQGLAGLDIVPVTDAGQDTPAETVTLAPELPAACLLTSGSTGVPQPHLKHWGTLVRNAVQETRRLAALLQRPGLDGLNIVATVPPQHSYGFESSVLLALQGGAAFDAGRPFYPADIATALQRLPHPRALVTTPFHLKTLLRSGVELPAVDLVLSATAPLSPQLAQETERRCGAVLVEIYGCTEAGQVATRCTARSDLWHTFDGLRITRLPGQHEQEHEGERYSVQGGHVTKPTLLADILELQDAEHFRLLGRANDLIHVAGKRSSLGHLNFHLNSIEGVEDGAFWVPDEVADGVARPVAFVVAPALSARDIAAALRARIEAVFVPRRIVHLPRLPRETTGKLTAQSLRQLAREHLSPPAS